MFVSIFLFFFKPFAKFCKDFCLWTSMHGFNHIAWDRRHWFERLLWALMTALAIWGAVDISLGQLQRYNENPTVVALEKDFRTWRYNLPAVTACEQVSINTLSPMKRLLWALMTALAIWGAVDISLGQLQRYNENPTVVALEKDFRTWRYNLPAVTACEQNRVNPAKLPEVIRSYWNVTPEHAKYEYYSKFVYTVANSDIYNLTGYQQFKDDHTLDVDFVKLAIEVVPEMSVKLTFSEEVDPPLPPNLAWTPVLIEAGACYTINSLAIGDVATVPVTKNDTSAFPITCKYSPMFCSIMLEISTGGFDFYVHSNFDIVDVTFPPFRVILTQISSSFLDVSTTRDGRGVATLEPGRRGCRYTEEPVDNRNVFSTNTCRLSCRSKLAVKLCGCKPFYYFYEEGEVCGVAGMACLATHAQVLANNAGDRCACAQQCVDAVFKEISTLNKFWEKGLMMNRGSLRLVVTAPRTRYTREIIFHFQDLVVSFGGAAGLFLGASFISFVEIFYFLLEKTLGCCIGGAVGKTAINSGKQVKHNEPRVSYEAARIEQLTRILEAQKRFDHDRQMKMYY